MLEEGGSWVKIHLRSPLVLDTRVLLNKITAFRERLEQMPRLVPESLPKAEPAP